MTTLPRADKLRELLGTGSMWDPITVVGTTGSTNADLAALAREGAGEGHVLVACEQTGGRGRLGRTWVSPAGASLSVSLLLEPTPPASQWGWLSLLAGLAVTAGLADLAPEPGRVELKWPNDVLIGGAKVCGILSERVEHANGPRAVVGFGLNVALERDQLPVPTATSLLLEGICQDQNTVLAGILTSFSGYYRRWQSTGTLRAEYEARCASVGAPLTIHLGPDQTRTGRGHGVDDEGRLQVMTERGVETFAVGDVVHARLQR